MSHCARDIGTLQSGGCCYPSTLGAAPGCHPRRARRGYARHCPEQRVLYQVVEQFADAFFAHLSERDATLPGFVRDEFEAFLRCGRLEHGFLRVKCNQCHHEHLVVFSCKCRGLLSVMQCATHGGDCRAPGRPCIPARTGSSMGSVFSVAVRLLFAARPEVLTRVLNVVTRAVSSAVLKRAGLSRSAGGETGSVTFIQRFGLGSKYQHSPAYAGTGRRLHLYA